MGARRQIDIWVNGEKVVPQLKNVLTYKRDIVRSLKDMQVGAADYEDAIKRLKGVDGILDEHKNNLKKTGGQYDLLKGGLNRFAGVAAAAFATDQIIAYGKDLFKLGLELDNTERKARTVFAGALPQVDAAAKKNATEIGLTTQGYVKLAAEIGDLLVPMGFQREEAAGLSTNLLNLSGALTEWAGGQYTAEETAKSLQKALLGEREELERYGISLKQSEVNARVAEKGLKGLTGAALQQAEAMVTLEAITEKSIDAQTAFAENSESNARRQARLSASFQQLKEDLAVALIPVFERLMGVAETVVDIFEGIGTAIGSITDPAKTASKAFDEQTQRVKDLEGELTPLLSRYDELSGKTTLTKDEQTELASIIKRVGEITPGAVTSINQYGEALTINAGASRQFLEAERARLLFTQREAIEATKEEIKELKERARVLNKESETGQGYRSAPFPQKLKDQELLEVRDNLLKTTTLLKGAEAELKRLRGEPISGVPSTDGGETPEEKAKRLERERQEKLEAEKRQKAADARKKEAEKAEKELEKQLERLQEIRASFEEKAKLAALDEDERRLEELRLKYDKEIAVAKELEAKGVTEATAQRIALERLKEEELNKLRDELSEAAVSRLVEDLTKLTETEMEQRLLQEEKKKELEATLKEEADAVLLTERELAIQELELFYTTMLEQATQFGLDREQIDMIYRAKLLEINKEFDKKDKESLAKAQDEKLKALQAAFSGISDLFGSLYDFLADEESEFAGFQKLITLTQIAIDTASAISSLTAASEANAANATTFGLAGVAQFAAGLARIITNIAKAKQLLSAEVPQKVTGGFVTVTGADDGRSYNARRVGAPGTGMLPPGPALVDTVAGPVLANEVAQEYFVSADALRNPQVFDMVRAIDNISRTRQFRDGGYTSSDTGAAVAERSRSEAGGAGDLTPLLRRLLAVLESGIYARVDDDTIIDMRNRLNVLERAAGN